MTSSAKDSSRRSIVLYAKTLYSELNLTPTSLEPSQFPHSPDYYARHNRDYFDISKPSGYVWKTNHAICPGLEQFIASFKQDTMQTADNIAGRRLRIKPNLRSSERRVVRTVLNKNVGYNDSDKHFGPVLYSRDLYLEQCRKHLFDGKGTYEYTDKPKDLILEDVTRRLKTLLYDCFGTEPATKSLAQTLTKWADDSLKRARLANFYVIWKLHKKANLQGVRSRPIWISNRRSISLSAQPAGRLRKRTYPCAQGLVEPHPSAGISVIAAGSEYTSDIGGRCSALPFD